MMRLTGEPTYLRLTGSPYEAGKAHGRRFEDLIQYTWRRVRRRVYGWPARKLAARLRALVRETGRRFPEEIEEIHGIADGAGLEFPAAFLINRHLGGALGCSTVAFCRCPAGPVAGGNVDDDPIYFMKDCGLSGQYRYIATAWPGTLGDGNGMNEHGLALMGSSASPVFRRFPGPPEYLTDDFAVAARVLRRCRTVAEAVELITRPDVGGHGNHLLVDASGDAACVEKRRHMLLGVRRPDEAGFLFTLNYFALEFNTPRRMAKMEPRNVDRLAAMQAHRKRLKGCGSAAMVKRILADTFVRKSTYPISNQQTAMSTVAFPRKGLLQVTDGPPHLGRYKDYSLR